MNRQISYKLRTGQAKLPVIELKPVKTIPKDAELILGEYYIIDENCGCSGCDLDDNPEVCLYIECNLLTSQGYKKVIN